MPDTVEYQPSERADMWERSRRGITVDHVTPVALGGSDEPSNLVAACADCNIGKSSASPDAELIATVADDALRWAAALRKAAEIRAAQIADRNELCGWFNMIWYDWTDRRGEPFEGPGTWRQIPDFIAAGLTRDDIQEALTIAMQSQTRDKWSYFCGVCWRMIRQAQDVARQIIESEATE